MKHEGSVHTSERRQLEQAAAVVREDTLFWVVAFLDERGFREAADAVRSEVFEPIPQPIEVAK